MINVLEEQNQIPDLEPTINLCSDLKEMILQLNGCRMFLHKDKRGKSHICTQNHTFPCFCFHCKCFSFLVGVNKEGKFCFVCNGKSFTVGIVVIIKYTV